MLVARRNIAVAVKNAPASTVLLPRVIATASAKDATADTAVP